MAADSLTCDGKAAIFGDVLPADVLARVVPNASPDVAEWSHAFLQATMNELASRDPLERMLVQQLV